VKRHRIALLLGAGLLAGLFLAESNYYPIRALQSINNQNLFELTLTREDGGKFTMLVRADNAKQVFAKTGLNADLYRKIEVREVK